MRNLHFENAPDPDQLPGLVGQSPVKPATHFVDPNQKLLGASSVKKGEVYRKGLYVERLLQCNGARSNEQTWLENQV